MNSEEDQSDSTLPPRYIDPEAIDMSEQQFSASLDEASERPHFEVDVLADANQADANSEGALRSREQQATSQLAAQEVEPSDSSAPDYGATGWREEVSAKVNRYKMRRPRQHRYPSLQLKFEPLTYSERKSELELMATTAGFTETGMTDSRPQLPPPQPQVALEATARVLEFPRPVIRQDELAEPVIDRPRILEAPELLPPPPAMGGILIDPPVEPVPERRPGIDVPLQTAPLERRLTAGVIDVATVSLALAAFWSVFLRLVSVRTPLRFDIELSAGLLVLLWPAYQYALLVFSGTTPGLRVTKLKVQRFDGSPVSRKLRRWRVLASVLSGLSLGLGYAWCFLDEDQLSWHDRITKTHLALRSVCNNGRS